MIWLTPDRLIAACMSCLAVVSMLPGGAAPERGAGDIENKAPPVLPPARIEGFSAASNPAAAATSPLAFRRDEEGLFRVVALCDGVPIIMILDTGATLTLLSEADAQRVFQSRKPRDGGAVQTIGGLRPLGLHHLSKVEIAGTTLRNLKVGVVPGAAYSVVGTDWLEKLGPILLQPEPE